MLIRSEAVSESLEDGPLPAASGQRGRAHSPEKRPLAPPDAGVGGTGADSASDPTASYRVLVWAVSGLHRGAAAIANPGESLLIGSASECDFGLLDDGVPDRAVHVSARDGLLHLEVHAVGVRIEGQLSLEPGVHTLAHPQVSVSIGDAVLMLEVLRRRGRSAEPALQTSARGAPIFALPFRSAPARFIRLALLSATGLALAGGLSAWAVRGASLPLSFGPSQVDQAQVLAQLVAHFNAGGAELTLDPATDNTVPKVRGLVANALTRQALLRALSNGELRVAHEVYDVSQMQESLERLLRLNLGKEHGLCKPVHQGQGEFVCTVSDTLPGSASPESLMRLARKVPGVSRLTLEITKNDREYGSTANASSEVSQLEATRLASESHTSETTLQPRSPNSSSLPRWPAVHHVALVGTELIAYDGQGRRLMEGAFVDGVRVTSIRPDVVTFEYEGRSFRQSVKGFSEAGASSQEAVR